MRFLSRFDFELGPSDECYEWNNKAHEKYDKCVKFFIVIELDVCVKNVSSLCNALLGIFMIEKHIA